MNTFIDSIELYPDKKQSEGSYIKMVHFKFSVAYSDEPVYDISPRKATTDESLESVDKHIVLLKQKRRKCRGIIFVADYVFNI